MTKPNKRLEKLKIADGLSNARKELKKARQLLWAEINSQEDVDKYMSKLKKLYGKAALEKTIKGKGYE